MPAVRAIVYELLQGLQSKQAPYRKALEGQRTLSSGMSALGGTPSPTEEGGRVLREFKRSG